MDAIYMEATVHHSGHVCWIIHKTKKAAITAARFGVERCGLKESRVYEIDGIDCVGWYLKTDLLPQPEHLKHWKIVFEIHEEVEQ